MCGLFFGGIGGWETRSLSPIPKYPKKLYYRVAIQDVWGVLGVLGVGERDLVSPSPNNLVTPPPKPPKHPKHLV